MKMRGISYVLIAIIMAMATIIISSLTMKYFESKLLPVLAAGIVLVLAVAALWREIAPGKEQRAAISNADGEEIESTETWRGYLFNGAWVVGFLLAIYVLGFIVAIAFFVLSYMKWLGTKWRTSVISAAVTSALAYFIFERAMEIEMYRGLILVWLEH